MRLTQLMLVPEVRGVSLEIILAAHLNWIRDPRPHSLDPSPIYLLILFLFLYLCQLNLIILQSIILCQ